MSALVVDSVLYINLAHRTDRNEHILNELEKHLGNSSIPVHRIDAVRDDAVPARGCTKSHIKAIEFALGKQHHHDPNQDPDAALDHDDSYLLDQAVMILEDDFTFRPHFSMKTLADTLVASFDFDVFLLAYNSRHDFFSYEEFKKPIVRVRRAQTTSGYIVRRRYLPVLLKNYRDGLSDMMQNGKNCHNCIDIYWKHLMQGEEGRWYSTIPLPFGYQYANYSDIECRYIDNQC
jgi:GR25 family glycosyltransferase involved in LPS biosynthesis